MLQVGSKFSVTDQGQIQATDVQLSGEITATAGQIGGFSLSNNSLIGIGSDKTASSVELNPTSVKFRGDTGSAISIETGEIPAIITSGNVRLSNVAEGYCGLDSTGLKFEMGDETVSDR